MVMRRVRILQQSKSDSAEKVRRDKGHTETAIIHFPTKEGVLIIRDI